MDQVIDELTERILAAIEEAELVALRASAHGERWHVGEKPWCRWGLDDRDAVVVSGGKPTITCHHEHDGDVVAEHVTHNDPAATLIRCAADRRTVERHEPHSADYLRCVWCGEHWPCPDLLDRAAAYGVEVGQPRRTPTDDDITHGTRVRVLPGPRYGTPDLSRNHGLGRVTWLSKNIDPAKTRFGVVMDDGIGTSEAGLADVEMVDDEEPGVHQ